MRRHLNESGKLLKYEMILLISFVIQTRMTISGFWVMFRKVSGKISLRYYIYVYTESSTIYS